jgi:hypothetical protein
MDPPDPVLALVVAALVVAALPVVVDEVLAALDAAPPAPAEEEDAVEPTVPSHVEVELAAAPPEPP